MDDERRRSSVLQIQGDEQDEQNEAEQKMASKTNGAMSVEDDNDVISMIFIEFCGISESFRKFARFSWVVRPERPKQPEHTHTHTHRIRELVAIRPESISCQKAQKMGLWVCVLNRRRKVQQRRMSWRFAHRSSRCGWSR